MNIKHEFLIIGAVLISVITVLPAAIVVPFSNASTETVDMNETVEVDLETSDQPVVQVMRSATEKSKRSHWKSTSCQWSHRKSLLVLKWKQLKHKP